MIQDTELSHNLLIVSNCFLVQLNVTFQKNTEVQRSHCFRMRANIARIYYNFCALATDSGFQTGSVSLMKFFRKRRHTLDELSQCLCFKRLMVQIVSESQRV